MAEQTPRVNASILEQFTHRTVRILGKVTQLRGEEATIDAGGQINVHLNRVSFGHLCTQVLFHSGWTLSFHLVSCVKLLPKALYRICHFLRRKFSKMFPTSSKSSLGNQVLMIILGGTSYRQPCGRDHRKGATRLERPRSHQHRLWRQHWYVHTPVFRFLPHTATRDETPWHTLFTF